MQPSFIKEISETVDLASVYSGGRTVYVSDQHFGKGSNLLLPGRGMPPLIVLVKNTQVRAFVLLQVKTWEMAGKQNGAVQKPIRIL